jgi:hypothetical protein
LLHTISSDTNEELEPLTPFTKDVFGYTLYEWRLTIIQNGFGDLYSQTYRIIAKDQLQAIELLNYHTELYETRAALIEAWGDDPDEIDLSCYSPFEEENNDTFSVTKISDDYNGIVNNEETCPSITLIDVFNMKFEETTKFEDWVLPYGSNDEEVAEDE